MRGAVGVTYAGKGDNICRGGGSPPRTEVPRDWRLILDAESICMQAPQMVNTSHAPTNGGHTPDPIDPIQTMPQETISAVLQASMIKARRLPVRVKMGKAVSHGQFEAMRHITAVGRWRPKVPPA